MDAVSRIERSLSNAIAIAEAPGGPPLLAAALSWNAHIGAFRAEVGGSGQAGAPVAAAFGLMNTLRTRQVMPVPVPEPGRANVIACSGYLPSDSGSCGWAVDSRESGLALGAN